MIPHHMPGHSIIISDNSLAEGLESEDHDTLQSAQIIIDYLAYKKQNKSAVMIPKIYGELLEKVKKKNNEELLRWVESFFCEAKIGISPTNPNSQEYKTVLEYLSYVHNELIFFTTEDKTCIEVAKTVIPSILVGDVKAVCNWIQTHDKEFSDKIFESYFSQSS